MYGYSWERQLPTSLKLLKREDCVMCPWPPYGFRSPVDDLAVVICCLGLKPKQLRVMMATLWILRSYQQRVSQTMALAHSYMKAVGVVEDRVSGGAANSIRLEDGV